MRTLQNTASVLLFASLSMVGCGAHVVAVDADSGTPTDGPDVIEPRPDVPLTPPDSRPPEVCSFSATEYAAIAYRGPSGEAYDCSALRTPGGMPGVTPSVDVRTASVVSVVDDAQGSTVQLDFCSPAADCVPRIGTLRVVAPTFALASGSAGLRAGQFVEVRSRATWSWGCTMQVAVYNSPSWGGVDNPVRRDRALLAAASNGEVRPLPDSPFDVGRQSIGCAMPGTSCGGGNPEVFALSFQGHCSSCESDPPPVTVRQSRSMELYIEGERYLARNHRSFNSGACDDYWNYAWTLREAPSE